MNSEVKSLEAQELLSQIIEIKTESASIEVVDDTYSDRLRCDHPPLHIPSQELAESLLELVENSERNRVVALVHAEHSQALQQQGFTLEGVIPGFYRGESDCAVLGFSQDENRMQLANPIEVANADLVMRKPFEVQPMRAVTPTTELAGVENAAEIANLIAQTFPDYPTASDDPAYIARQIQEGTPFRYIRVRGKMVACASADLVPNARTAELTDCATNPTYRGRGYMQRILLDLMGDLQAMHYPTAFTLARARIPGINRVFQKLGFRFRGRMAQSCRIGDGLEDMNIWSRSLPEPG